MFPEGILFVSSWLWLSITSSRYEKDLIIVSFEKVYISLPEALYRKRKEHLVWKMHTFFRLKQTCDCWKISTSFGVIENKAEKCIYLQASGSNLFVWLSFNDIIIASSYVGTCCDINVFVSKFVKKCQIFTKTSSVFGIEIVRYRSYNLLGLS